MSLVGPFLAAALAAAAQPAAPLPAYTVGDAFVFSDGRVEQVRAIDGEIITWGGLGGDTFQRSRDFTQPILGWRFNQGEGRRLVSGHPEALWPLAPGRSSRFSVLVEFRRTPDSPWERTLMLWTCHVGAAHDVEVPAGTFTALPVTCDRYSPVNMRLQERVQTEYAPDVGHYIRRSFTDYFAARTFTMSLTSELHGAAASRARLSALAAQATRAKP